MLGWCRDHMIQGWQLNLVQACDCKTSTHCHLWLRKYFVVHRVHSYIWLSIVGAPPDIHPPWYSVVRSPIVLNYFKNQLSSWDSLLISVLLLCLLLCTGGIIIQQGTYKCLLKGNNVKEVFFQHPHVTNKLNVEVESSWAASSWNKLCTTVKHIVDTRQHPLTW